MRERPSQDQMIHWCVDQVVHFEPGDFVISGLAHFGFHVEGRYYGISHQHHYLGAVGDDGQLEWTAARAPVFADVPNIAAELEFPMYVDRLPDGTLLVSNFEAAQLFRIDPETMSAVLLVDGHDHGLVDMGNCVVADDGAIWVNEVRGCRIWRFDQSGRVLERLGDGSPGYQREPVEFDRARFNWIYDMRPGPDGTIYVLDGKNFAVRVVDPSSRTVLPYAGTGEPGYSGDGRQARAATFGSDPTARFDGPISLALDEQGNVYVGDKFNRVLRMIDRVTGTISTIAGRARETTTTANDPNERDPLQLHLPWISSLDYADGRLFIPTDLEGEEGDLAVLRRR